MAKKEHRERFEDLLTRLERLVHTLESDELDLEKSLEAYEEGVKVARECHARLDEADRRVEVLRRLPTGEVVADPHPGEGR